MTLGEATDATEVLGEGWMRASPFRERRMSSTFEPQVFCPRRVEYGDLAKGTLRPPLIPTYPRSATRATRGGVSASVGRTTDLPKSKSWTIGDEMILRNGMRPVHPGEIQHKELGYVGRAIGQCHVESA